MADLPKSSKPLILTPPCPYEEAVSAYEAGGVIAYPTETFYGLGVDPFNAAAVERLFALKGRAFDRPVSVLVPDFVSLFRVVATLPPLAERLIERFWPGPLTIVLPAREELPALLTAGTGKVGVRVSSFPVCRELLYAIGGPLTTTSANPSGERPPVTAEEVRDYFGGSIDVLIDGGRLSGTKGSTVVDATGANLVILREGEVSKEELEEW